MSKQLVFVTGGSSGIGRSLVNTLIGHGYTVAFTYRSNEAAAKEMVQELGHESCHALHYSASEGLDEKNARSLVDKLGSPVALVNNIGAEFSLFGKDVKASDLQSCVDANIRPLIDWVGFVWPYFLRQRLGHVVNISSAAVDNVRVGNGLYAASKSFIERFGESLAVEGARSNIAVNCIVPGYVETQMTRELLQDPAKKAEVLRGIPSRRMQTSDDVARVVANVLNNNVFITGSRVPVTGGAHL